MIRKTLGVPIILLLLALSLIIMGVYQASADDEHHSVLLNVVHRQVSWSGDIEFINDHSQSVILLDNGERIRLNVGDAVKIVMKNQIENGGHLWIGKNGWVDIHNIPVDKIYVNGVLKANDSEIRRTHSVRVESDTLNSTLKVEVQGSPSGWTHLKVDDTNVIKGDSGDYVILYNLTATEDEDLNIDFSISHHSDHYTLWLEGAGLGAEWGDESGSNVIGVPEYPVIIYALAILASVLLSYRLLY